MSKQANQQPCCANCRRPMHRQRNGAWYHTRNASTACYPGTGSSKRAELANVTAQPEAMSETCWADPLTRAERRTLAARIGRAAKKVYAERDDRRMNGLYFAALGTAGELMKLHLDVTERAEVAS